MLALQTKSNGMCGPAQKLDMDFIEASRLRVGMDENTIELISHLCTRAGMIMEDASHLALTIGATKGDHQSKQLRRLAQAAEQINLLIRAAMSLDG